MERRSLLEPITRRPDPWRRERPDDGGPALEECMAVAARSMMEMDQGRREAGLAAVRRTMTGALSGGSGGAFAIKPEYDDVVWDRARSVDGPLARCMLRPTLFREFSLPAFDETSRANGSRWGGVQASIGLPETTLPASTQPKIARVSFQMWRFLVYLSPVSRDLLADTELVTPLLSYASQAEIRFSLEQAMLQGAGPVGPVGVVNNGQPGPGVVLVAKESGQSAGTIVSNNIDKMWAALYGPCKRTAIWSANDDVIQAIDAVATTYNWPQNMYLPAGIRDDGFARLKGRPLIPAEACPAIGTPGDLTLADWSQYWLAVHRPKPSDSTLSFDVRHPDDVGHQGIKWLPEGSVEQRMSDEKLWDTDSVSFLWKMRCDGKPLWTGTVTNINGAALGWAAVLAAR